MENLLPTITILMAEASLVLLVLLIVLLYRYGRRKRQHQAEIEALIEMAHERRGAPSVAAPLAAASQATASPAAPTVADPAVGAASAPARRPEATALRNPPPPADAETGAVPEETRSLIGTEQIAQGLAEIRQAMELLDGKVSQVRHDHHKLAAHIHRTMDRLGKEAAATRHEIDALGQVLNEIRRRMVSSAAAVPAAAAARAAAPRAPAGTRAPAEQAASQPAAQSSAPPKPAPADDPDYVLDAATLERLSNTAQFGVPSAGIAVEEISLSELNVDDPHGIGDAGGPPFSSEDQIFFQSSTTEEMEQGWYFSMIGAQPQGPFADKRTAERVLAEMRGKTGHTGWTARRG